MTDKTPTMQKSSRKRLQKDIVDILKYPLTDHGIHYVHDSENMLKGYAVIFGPSDSLYRYGAYYFSFKFPTNYPFQPPKLTYLTNDGDTRFNPNLYRNGKVCISVLNTWKGEQWTSCQNIKSILLTLVTLFHNKPLLNEPGFTERHRSFIPYNNIIRYRNLQVALLKPFTGKNNTTFNMFLPIYKKYIKENKDTILKYVSTLKSLYKKETFKVNVYNMTCIIDYETLEKKLTDTLNNIN
jgi:ubiquitin-conjugating enzyme E2 Z